MLRLLLALREHVVEGVVADGAAQALDPLVALLRRSCRHSVNSMFSLDDLPLGVSLAGLDEISAATRVQLQTVRSLSVARWSHRNIL